MKVVVLNGAKVNYDGLLAFLRGALEDKETGT